MRPPEGLDATGRAAFRRPVATLAELGEPPEMGHASISITLDRYGHLFPASVDESRRQFGDYLG